MRYLAIILILLPIPFYLSQKNNPPLEDQKVELTAAEEARIFEIINNSKKTFILCVN